MPSPKNSNRSFDICFKGIQFSGQSTILIFKLSFSIEGFLLNVNYIHRYIWLMSKF